ncbi:hypothetical protein ACIQWA_27990 [Kitasatospora sp. NPDC098652]|uniref:hypothetical protein n=1 Tax=Kitasatospora sp. NPDC098652 TaxID=3364095 RepID=UPI0038034746
MPVCGPLAEGVDGEQHTTQLDEGSTQQALSALVGEATFYLKAGRKITHIDV